MLKCDGRANKSSGQKTSAPAKSLAPQNDRVKHIASDTRRKFIQIEIATTCAFILASCSFLAAQAPAAPAQNSEGTSAPRSSSEQASSPALPDYIIAPEDVLKVSVYDSPDISGEYRVGPAGQLELPLLSEPIAAAGLTPARLSRLIGAKYQDDGIISHPQVTVAVKDSRIHSITIAGAVKKPQIYPLFGRTTLLDVLSQAGGLAEDAGNTAIVTRGSIAVEALKQSGACESPTWPDPCAATFTVDLKRLVETGDPALNVELYPGDRVTVQRAGIVYVVGEVNRPGGFPLRSNDDEMTVLKALALAEDTKSTAQKSKAMIIRKNPQEKNGRQEIAVNLKKVLAGRAADLRMEPNDILFVPDSPGKKAIRRGAEAAITAATWGFIYHY